MNAKPEPTVQMFEVPGDRLRALRQAEGIIDSLRDLIRSEDAKGDAWHDHKWSVRGVNRLGNKVYPGHPQYSAAQGVTLVLLRCDTCEILIVQKLEGQWTDEQLGVVDAPAN